VASSAQNKQSFKELIPKRESPYDDQPVKANMVGGDQTFVPLNTSNLTLSVRDSPRLMSFGGSGKSNQNSRQNLSSSN